MSFISLLALSSALVVTSGCGQAHDSMDDALAARIEAQLDLSTTLDQPGFALGIAGPSDQKIVVTSGAANLEHSVPITADTVFHAASLSKQITAATLAYAIEDGRVTLDDPVAQWIPEASHFGPDLTLAHLVYMTSGVPEYTNQVRDDERPWLTFHYFDIEEALAASLSAETLEFEPGTRWAYSNINYMLIAETVSRAYDRPFEDLANEWLFEPLGMDRTLIHADITQLVPGRADAYVPRSEDYTDWLNNTGQIYATEQGEWMVFRRNAPHYGGSGVMSSLNDWITWQTELQTGEVLGQSFLALMRATRRFEHDKDNDAFGLVHGQYEDRPTLWYAGGDIDSSSYAIAFPESGTHVTCLSNAPTMSCQDRIFSILPLLEEAGWLDTH